MKIESAAFANPRLSDSLPGAKGVDFNFALGDGIAAIGIAVGGAGHAPIAGPVRGHALGPSPFSPKFRDLKPLT